MVHPRFVAENRIWLLLNFPLNSLSFLSSSIRCRLLVWRRKKTVWRREKNHLKFILNLSSLHSNTFCHFFDENWRSYLDVIIAKKKIQLCVEEKEKPKAWNEICLHVLREAQKERKRIYCDFERREISLKPLKIILSVHLDSLFDWHKNIVLCSPQFYSEKRQSKNSNRIFSFGWCDHC